MICPKCFEKERDCECGKDGDSLQRAGCVALTCGADDVSAGGWWWWRPSLDHEPCLAMVNVFPGIEPHVTLHNQHGASLHPSIKLSRLGGMWGGAAKPPETWHVALPHNE